MCACGMYLPSKRTAVFASQKCRTERCVCQVCFGCATISTCTFGPSDVSCRGSEFVTLASRLSLSFPSSLPSLSTSCGPLISNAVARFLHATKHIGLQSSSLMGSFNKGRLLLRDWLCDGKMNTGTINTAHCHVKADSKVYTGYLHGELDARGRSIEGLACMRTKPPSRYILRHRSGVQLLSRPIMDEVDP